MNYPILRKEKKSIGNFNLRWFVTRGNALSGAKKGGKRFTKWDSRVKTKFYNHNHTKFLTADNQIAIVGSANWDEQSWYNSRELNLLIHGHKITNSLCQKVFKDDFFLPWIKRYFAHNLQLGIYPSTKYSFLWDFLNHLMV